MIKYPKTISEPISFKVKKNHIGSAVSEIPWARQKTLTTLYNRIVYNSTIKLFLND